MNYDPLARGDLAALVSTRSHRASDPLARGDLAALVSTRSHRAPFVLMPRDADALRARLLQKLTAEREEEQRNALNGGKLRAAQIKETHGKIQGLDIAIGKGTGLLRDIEKVSAQIRVHSWVQPWAQSFSEEASQDKRDADSLALDRLDLQRVSMERNLAEWNDSVSMLQDFLKQLTDY